MYTQRERGVPGNRQDQSSRTELLLLMASSQLGKPDSASGGSNAIRIRQQVLSRTAPAVSTLDELSKHGSIRIWASPKATTIVVDVQAQGMEAQEKRHPAQVGDNRSLCFSTGQAHCLFILISRSRAPRKFL